LNFASAISLEKLAEAIDCLNHSATDAKLTRLAASQAVNSSLLASPLAKFPSQRARPQSEFMPLFERLATRLKLGTALHRLTTP
jgi:hypothetical protein